MRFSSDRSPWSVVLLFLIPSLAGFLLFVLIPAATSVVFSFGRYGGGALRTFRFVGLSNYVRAFGSEAFRQSLWVTFKFVGGTIVVELAIALVFALIVNMPIRARNTFRGLLFLPNMLSAVAISLAFSLIFHPQKGPMNSFLESIGLSGLPWLASQETSLLTIMIIFIWQNFGYFMLIFLSGLQSISPAYYEAADIEGAGATRKLLSITLPLLSPVTFLAVVLAVIRSFSVFDQIFILTGGQAGGGPAGSTSVIVFDIYRHAFSYFEMGYASAEAVILLLIVLSITLVQYRGQRKWVNYDTV